VNLEIAEIATEAELNARADRHNPDIVRGPGSRQVAKPWAPSASKPSDGPCQLHAHHRDSWYKASSP
jgi:hypothetical protein